MCHKCLQKNLSKELYKESVLAIEELSVKTMHMNGSKIEYPFVLATEAKG